MIMTTCQVWIKLETFRKWMFSVLKPVCASTQIVLSKDCTECVKWIKKPLMLSMLSIKHTPVCLSLTCFQQPHGTNRRMWECVYVRVGTLMSSLSPAIPCWSITGLALTNPLMTVPEVCVCACVCVLCTTRYMHITSHTPIHPQPPYHPSAMAFEPSPLLCHTHRSTNNLGGHGNKQLIHTLEGHGSHAKEVVGEMSMTMTSFPWYTWSLKGLP